MVFQVAILMYLLINKEDRHFNNKYLLEIFIEYNYSDFHTDTGGTSVLSIKKVVTNLCKG